MNVFLSELLSEINRLRKQYHFKDDKTVICLDESTLAGNYRPRLALRTIDRDGTELTFRILFSKDKCGASQGFSDIGE